MENLGNNIKQVTKMKSAFDGVFGGWNISKEESENPRL